MSKYEKFMKEMISITILPSGEMVVLLGEEFSKLSEGQQKQMVRAFTVLARDQISKNLRNTPMTKIVEYSELQEHNNVVLEIKILTNFNKDVQALVYFGKRCKKNYSAKLGLAYVLEVLDLVAKQYE